LKILVCLGKGLEAGVLCACVEFRLSYESIPVLWRCSCCTVDLSRSQSQWISVLHYGHSRHPLNQHGAVPSLHCFKNCISPRLSFAIIKLPYSVHPIPISPFPAMFSSVIVIPVHYRRLKDPFLWCEIAHSNNAIL
jgi:hypothetical protein